MAKTDNSNKLWWVVLAGIIVTVVGGLILAFIMSDAFRLFVYSISSGSWQAAVWFLTAKSVMPIYLIAFLCVAALVAVGYLWRQAYEKTEDYKTSFLHYWQDTFDGALWKWAYERGRPTPPHPECIRDGTPLVYQETSLDVYSTRLSTYWHCERCGFRTPALDGGHFDYAGRIRRMIEGKINSGEYLALIDTKKPS